MSLSGIAKFFIGFLLGIALLVGAGAAAAYYFWTKLSVEPPKHIFAEEQVKPSPVTKKSTPPASSNQIAKPPTPTKTPAKLPAGAYKARVSWAEGLILRDAPGADANRTGGVAFNQEVFVIQESDDQRWQKVRVADGEREGWIKAGNTERVN